MLWPSIFVLLKKGKWPDLYMHGPCIAFVAVPHELLRRPLRSTESPFLREWQSNSPSASSTTIQKSGQNQRNLTQKGTVIFPPSCLIFPSFLPPSFFLHLSLPSSGLLLRRRQSVLLSATSPLAGALATALEWGLPSWRLRWLSLRSSRSTHLCGLQKLRLVLWSFTLSRYCSYELGA